MACPFPFCFGTATQVLHLLQGRCCATLARPFRTAVALRRFSLRSSFSVHAKPLRRSGLVQTAGGACGVCVLSVLRDCAHTRHTPAHGPPLHPACPSCADSWCYPFCFGQRYFERTRRTQSNLSLRYRSSLAFRCG